MIYNKFSMKNSLNQLGALTAAATLATSPEKSEAATIITDTSKEVAEEVTTTIKSPETLSSTTLLDMEGTGNTISIFGLYDGLTFTADDIGSISAFNYTGMPYAEGFVAQVDSITTDIIPGTQTTFGPSGTLSLPYAVNPDDRYIALFKTDDISTPFKTVNQAEIPDDSDFLNPETPISSIDGENLGFRREMFYGTLSVDGIPEPSSALLVGLGAAGLATRRRRKENE